MGAGAIEPERQGTGAWQNAHPKAKLVLALAYILAVTLIPTGRWEALLWLWLALWGAAYLAGVKLVWLLRRSLLALPFVLAALPLPLTVPGPAIGHLPVLGWAISAPGTVRLVTILARSWLAVQAAALLGATTPFSALLWALSGLGVPRILVSVIGLMYRYIFVLSDEAQRLLRARAARSADPPDPSWRRPGLLWRARIAGNMAGVLFIRAIERSERVYAAMLSRGYQGNIPLMQPPAWARRDTALLAGGLAVSALAVAWGVIG